MFTHCSPTPTWHTNSYPAISPANPSLSCAGKTVVVTGGGAGIGKETARAFAEAGAKRIGILGRREQVLQSTRDELLKEFGEKGLEVVVAAADVKDVRAMKEAAGKYGEWDVLCLNAGYMADKGLIPEAEADEWWNGFEINVLGTFTALQAFLPTRRRGGAAPTVISTNAAIHQAPQAFCAGWSSYSVSKAASAKLIEAAAAEVPDVRFVSIHPGVIETPMANKMGGPVGGLGYDDIKLPAHFTLWLASDEAEFLRGKFVWCNWDVNELREREKEIRDSELFTLNVLGTPLTGLFGPTKEWQKVDTNKVLVDG